MFGLPGYPGWMNEPEPALHRRAVLACVGVDTGVGVAQGSDGALWWTQDFAIPQPPPDTSPDLVSGGKADGVTSTTTKVTDGTAATFDCTTKARSVGDRTVSQTIVVLNRSGRVLTISFLDDKGAKVLSSKSFSGMKSTIPAFAGDKWLVEDDAGACVTGLAGAGTVTIGPIG